MHWPRGQRSRSHGTKTFTVAGLLVTIPGMNHPGYWRAQCAAAVLPAAVAGVGATADTTACPCFLVCSQVFLFVLFLYIICYRFRWIKMCVTRYRSVSTVGRLAACWEQPTTDMRCCRRSLEQKTSFQAFQSATSRQCSERRQLTRSFLRLCQLPSWPNRRSIVVDYIQALFH